jgi:DNA-binding transcriptional regulator YiaG
MARLFRYKGGGKQRAHEPYHYRECGLDDVFLANGFQFHEVDGEKGVVIQNVDGLHQAIADNIVRNKSLLAGKEIRFLRKQLRLTQADLAKWIGCDAQTVARWEKDQSKAPGSADRLVRLLYAGTYLKDVDIPAMIREVADLDEIMAKQVCQESKGDWKKAA